MNKSDIAHWWAEGLLALGIVWNKLGLKQAVQWIKRIDLRTDGLLVKYVKAEKAESRSKGVTEGRKQKGKA